MCQSTIATEYERLRLTSDTLVTEQKILLAWIPLLLPYFLKDIKLSVARS
jgi:hypothetical protein